LLICGVVVAVILLAKIILDAGCLTSSAISFEGKAEYLVVVNIKVQPHIVNFSISSRERPGKFFVIEARPTTNFKLENSKTSLSYFLSRTAVIYPLIQKVGTKSIQDRFFDR
jgi:hypothetical protein